VINKKSLQVLKITCKPFYLKQAEKYLEEMGKHRFSLIYVIGFG